MDQSDLLRMWKRWMGDTVQTATVRLFLALLALFALIATLLELAGV